VSAPTDPDLAFNGYQSAIDRFAAASSGTDVVVRTYRMAGQPVRVRIAGARLAHLFDRPWMHLVSREGETPAGAGTRDLHIDLWHSSETGVEAPPGIQAIDPLERFPWRTARNDRYLAVRQPETAVWFDRQDQRIVGAVGHVERRALYEVGRPLETPLLVWLRDGGVPLVHAGFVASRERGALILGRSGSGKSTLAAACVSAGFDFLSDDKVALEGLEGQEGREGREGREGGAVAYSGHSLNGSLHVDAGTLVRLPDLAESAVTPTLPIDDKYRIPVELAFPGQLRAKAPICALIIPTLQREPGGRVAPASKRDAFLALSLSSVLSLPIARANSLDPLAALVEHTPAFRLDLNPLETAPSRLADLLDSIPAALSQPLA